MLACDACRIVMEKLAKDVRYLSEVQKVWPDSVLDERLAVSCNDPQHPSGSGTEACQLFIADHAKLIKLEANARWDEDSEEFEEDINVAEFCEEKARVCGENEKGLNHMIGEANRKEKALKEEKEEKERAKKGR
mmetsp:Transcript_20541/g.33783  ORF Transcript_20541/g.33783 Transcript_20541/m.33783 type:complete len:134 (+) Transcript_20541:2-403(+)